MSKELKYSDDDVKARVDELLAAEIEKIDKEGVIADLKIEIASLTSDVDTLTNEKGELENTIAGFEGYLSPDEVTEKVEAEVKEAIAKLEKFNSRVAELTEAGVELDEELTESLRDMEDSAYALLLKVASAGKANADDDPDEDDNDEDDNDEDDEEIDTSKATASQEKTERLPNSGDDDEPKSEIARAGELVTKIIRRNREE